MAYHQEEKKEVKEVVVSTKEWHTCDFCGEVIKQEDYPYTKVIGKISITRTESYPEYGNEHSQNVDFCTKCWVGVILPWLDSLDVVTYEMNIDW